MADKILVSTEAMQEAINKYNSARETLQDSFTQLDNAKEHIDNVYDGAAYLALSAKYLSIKVNAKTAENGIQESIDGLTKTIQTMETTETSVKSTYQALDVGSAPSFLE